MMLLQKIPQFHHSGFIVRKDNIDVGAFLGKAVAQLEGEFQSIRASALIPIDSENPIKQFRRVATRYDKSKESYLGFVAIAAVKLWLPFVHEA